MEYGHPFTIYFELFTVESDFGLSAFFHVALKLINDFVFFLMAFIFSLYGLNICTIIGFFDLFLKKYFCVIGIKKKNIYLVNFKGTFYHTWARLDRDGEEKRLWSWAQFKLDRDRMVRDRQTSGQPLLFHPLNNQCRLIPLSSFATDIYVKTNKQTEKQTNKQADRERQAKM